MHTIRLPSLKTKSWWVISSATAFVFFFSVSFSIFWLHSLRRGLRGRKKESRTLRPRRTQEGWDTAAAMRWWMAKKKRGKRKKREERVQTPSRRLVSLSLSPLLFTIAYYFVIVFLPYCISVPCWLACFFLFFFLEHFFFSCLACRLALLFLHFLFFFFKSPTPWIYWGRTEKWGSTDSFFFFCLFVS